MERAADTAVRVLVASLRGSGLLVLALVGTAVGLLVALRKRPFGGGRLRGSGGQGAVRFYRELLRVLERKGFVTRTGMTPREFGEDVEARARPELAGISGVIDLYYGVRYGGRHLSESERQQVTQIISRLAKSRAGRSTSVDQTTLPASLPHPSDRR
jgi:hypothetical protein